MMEHAGGIKYEPVIMGKNRVRIGVLSDTHGHLPEGVLRFVEACDVVLHAGDIGSESVADTLEERVTLVAVHGNIDGGPLRLRFPEVQRIEVGGARLFMTHIAGYPGHYRAEVKKLLQEERPHLVVCGHSHILKIMYDKHLQHLHVNPGACGLSGWHTRLTAVRFIIEEGKPTNMEIWEKEKKGREGLAES
ncbi:MAG: metallophosphatase family protein [Flavobacteriales bacterium]|nr:metallophosphatase family protein [Flavobacteriales bacterium]